MLVAPSGGLRGARRPRPGRRSSSPRTAATPRPSAPRPGRTSPAVAFISGAAPRRGHRGVDRGGRLASPPRRGYEAPPLAGRDRRRQPGVSRGPRAPRLRASRGSRSARRRTRSSGRQLGRATVICDPDAGPRLLGLGGAGEALRLPRRGPAGRDDATPRDRERSSAIGDAGHGRGRRRRGGDRGAC